MPRTLASPTIYRNTPERFGPDLRAWLNDHDLSPEDLAAALDLEPWEVEPLLEGGVPGEELLDRLCRLDPATLEVSPAEPPPPSFRPPGAYEDDPEAFYADLRTWREYWGFTPEEVARGLGVTAWSVRGWEEGSRALPSSRRLRWLREADWAGFRAFLDTCR